MTSLLKPSGDTLTPLAWCATTQEPTRPTKDPLVEALELRVIELERALEDSETQAKDAIRAAYAEGERHAQEKFVSAEAAKLEALKAGLGAAVEGAKAQVQSLETLALVLCENALAKIFDQTSDYREIVARAVGLQMATLRREMVMHILVSEHDFSSDESLHELGSRLGGRGLAIIRDSELKAGDCRIELRLGHIDLSAPGYWKEVRERLHDLALSETS